MAARDIFHDTVKTALQKDGWTITEDPLVLRVGIKRLLVDLAAERIVIAEKELRKIAVEVKSFTGPSDVKDLEQAIGQYILYERALNAAQSDRTLYLAVNRITFDNVFTIEIGQILLRDGLVKLIVFDEVNEEIIQWISE